MEPEHQWLNHYATSRSEEAFAALVKLHLRMVYNTALRQVGNPSLAEEVTQTVFISFSQKAPALRAEQTVAGWLYQTTINQSKALLRSEWRRRKREETAASLHFEKQAESAPLASWVALLDEALLALRERDRRAVVLHCLEGRTYHEVGQLIGVGEDAARKRVASVLEQLGHWFRKRGIIISSAQLLGAITASSSAAVSPGLMLGILSAATTTAAQTVSLGAISALLFMTTTKKVLLAATLVATAIVGYEYFTPIGELHNQNRADIAKVAPTGPTTMRTPGTRELAPTMGVSAAAGEGNSRADGLPIGQFLQRLNRGDESLGRVSREQADAFVQANKTNAQSLLAAYKVTRDPEYLRKAALNFPDDPSAVLRAISHNVFPENNREWLEHYKKLEKENALPFYLSAEEHFQNANIGAALADLEEASRKPHFQDHLTEQILSLEELYLSAGHSAAEAKALAMYGLELPFLPRLGKMNGRIAELMDQYKAEGTMSTMERIGYHGLQAAAKVSALQDGGNLLGGMMSTVAERAVLERLDPSKEYAFLAGTVPDRINRTREAEKQIREAAQFVERWIASATDEAEVISYFDRFKMHGETGAIRWLQSRQNR